MTAAFCGGCGNALKPTARFCPVCGEAREQFATPPASGGRPPEAPRTPPLAGRVEQFSPGAGDFASQLATQAQAPGVIVAATTAAAAAGAMLVLALLLGLVYPDDSFLGAYGEDGGLVTESLSGAVSFLQVSFQSDVPGLSRIAPLLFVAIPIALCAAGVAAQGERTRGLPPRTRLAWGAATGVPFALLMMIFAIAGGKADPSVGGSFLLGLVFGALGGAAGAWIAVRNDSPQLAGTILPSQAVPVFGVLKAALKPFAVALLLASLIGTSVFVVQAFRDKPGARLNVSLATALSQNVAYSADFGVRYLALGTGSTFDTGANLPVIPTDDVTDLGSPPKRIFDYGDHVAAPLFIPLLIVLIGLPLILALYSGYSIARARRAAHPGMAAAWGALTGPIWALAMTLLNAMSQKFFPGPAVGDSVFTTMLLGGAVIGALGGLLAAQATGIGRPRRTG